MTLTYVRIGGRLQPLHRLSASERATLLAGAVEAVYEVTPEGATVEVPGNGTRRNGQPAEEPSLLGRLRATNPSSPPAPPRPDRTPATNRGGTSA